MQIIQICVAMEILIKQQSTNEQQRYPSHFANTSHVYATVYESHRAYKLFILVTCRESFTFITALHIFTGVFPLICHRFVLDLKNEITNHKMREKGGGFRNVRADTDTQITSFSRTEMTFRRDDF